MRRAVIISTIDDCSCSDSTGAAVMQQIRSLHQANETSSPVDHLYVLSTNSQVVSTLHAPAPPIDIYRARIYGHAQGCHVAPHFWDALVLIVSIPGSIVDTHYRQNTSTKLRLLLQYHNLQYIS